MKRRRVDIYFTWDDRGNDQVRNRRDARFSWIQAWINAKQLLCNPVGNSSLKHAPAVKREISCHYELWIISTAVIFALFPSNVTFIFSWLSYENFQNEMLEILMILHFYLPSLFFYNILHDEKFTTRIYEITVYTPASLKLFRRSII